jgi:glycosyltransferase involved in cell wall biosynthesis
VPFVLPVAECHVNIVQVNYAFDERIPDPDALLAAYTTLTGWSEALVSAGASRVSVVQRFHRDAEIRRNGVEYVFRRDSTAANPWGWPCGLHRAVVERAPDLAHVNGFAHPERSWLLRRVLAPSTAMIVQDHAAGPPRGHGSDPVRCVRRAVRRRAMRAFDGFLFSATEQAAPWREAGYIGPDQVVYPVMEASVTVRPIPKADARAATALEGAPAILWVGRLNRNKDPMTILDAVERAITRLPGAILSMIFSEADLLPMIHDRLRKSAPLSGRVRLIGAVPHRLMPAYYSAADIFVLGSHHEGSGYALLEASACGAVPVVTSIPPFRVITAGGTLGATFIPGDASECAKALTLVGRSDLQQASKQVRAHFVRALSWQAVGRDALNAYRQVLGRRHRNSPAS